MGILDDLIKIVIPPPGKPHFPGLPPIKPPKSFPTDTGLPGRYHGPSLESQVEKRKKAEKLAKEKREREEKRKEEEKKVKLALILLAGTVGAVSLFMIIESRQ